MENLVNQIVGIFANKYAIESDRKRNDAMYRMQRDFYDKQMQKNTSLFNRTYYRNYLDTPAARNVLKQVREQLDDRTKALRNHAVVTGATPEALAAVQKSNNKLLDSAVGRLAEVGERGKEKLLFNYENKRNTLDEYMHNATMKHMMTDWEIDNRRMKQNISLLQPAIASMSNNLEDGLSKLFQKLRRHE